VGQDAREEINYQPAGSAGGINYGWNIMEGSLCYNATTCNKNGLTLPVTEYSHTLGCSVTGGHVYRGSSYPALQGHYFYGDFCSGRLFDLYYSQANGWVSTQLLDTSYNITTFGESESGELYLVDYNHGGIYQVTYEETIFADVPSSNPYRTAIETIYVNRVTSGCNPSPLMYCPASSVTRAQMAVFLLRAKHGSAYTPPAATGDFADVPTNYWAATWIEQLAAEGITSGCATNPARYCPELPVTRDQMAVFLVSTFNLTIP
jgi:hypothetical protein